jgi:hypothetical protein
VKKLAKPKKRTRRRLPLGPAGPLGEDVIIEMYLRAKHNQITSVLPLNTLFNLIETHIFDPLDAYLTSKIEIWVPKDTGDLREALHKMVTRSKNTITRISVRAPFIVKLGTPGLEYAKPVNRMSSSMLQHKNQVSRKGNKLDDPKALQGWYNLLLLNGRNNARLFYNDFIKNEIVPLLKPLQTAGAIKSAWNFARSIFTVRFK